MSIYVHRDGTEYGPYTQEQIQEYLQDGNFEPNDWARTEELEDWVPLGELVHPTTTQPEPEPEAVTEPANDQAEPAIPSKGGLPRSAWGAIAAAIALLLGLGLWFFVFKPKPTPSPGAGTLTSPNPSGTTNSGTTNGSIIIPPAPTNKNPIPVSAQYLPADATMVISLRVKELIRSTGVLASLTGHPSYRDHLLEYMDDYGDLLDMVLKAPGHHGLDLDQPVYVFIRKNPGQGPVGRTVGVVAALADRETFTKDALPDWFNTLLPGQGDQAREKIKVQDGAHMYGEDSRTFALGYDDKALVILFVERPNPSLKINIANFFVGQDGLAANSRLLFREHLTRLDDLGYWRKNGDGAAAESFTPPAAGALASLDTEWAVNFKFRSGRVDAAATLRHDPKLLAAWGSHAKAGLDPNLLKLVPNAPMAVLAVSSHMPTLAQLVLQQVMPRHENLGVNRHSKAFKKQSGIELKDALAIPQGGLVLALTDVGMKLDENNQVHPEFRAVMGMDLSLTNQLDQLLASVKTNGIGDILAGAGIRHARHNNQLMFGTGPHTNTVASGAAFNPLPPENPLHPKLRTNHLALVVDLQKTEQLIRTRTALFRDYPSARILGDMRLDLWTHLTLTALASEGRVDFRLRLDAANKDLTGFRTLLDSHRDNVQFIRKKANEIACYNNIDNVRVAMRLWATAQNKPPNAAVSINNLLPFLQNRIPICPDGGQYFLTTLDKPCSCSKHSKKPVPPKN